MNEKSKKRRLALIWVAVILAAVVGITLWILESERGGGVTITAVDQDEEGIAPNTDFLLSLRKPPENIAELEDSITLDPPLPFAVEERGGDEYALVLGRPLAPEETLTITAGGRKQTFTARNQLAVATTSPAADATNVPVTSGIEFTFNTDDISLTRFMGAFSISPAAEGKFSTGSGRYVFYPAEENLAPDTNYTVTLAGLAGEGGAELREDYTLSFTTIEKVLPEGEKVFQFFGNGVGVNALSDEAPVFRAYLDPDFGAFEAGEEVAVKVFAYEGWEPYAQQLELAIGASETANLDIDTAAMPTVAEFGLVPIARASGDENDYYDRGSWIFQFPEPMAKGWYAAEFSFEKNGQTLSRQQLLQVSDTSVFYMWSGEAALVWVNGTATGQPVEGANISLDGGFSAAAVTGADGAASITDGTPPVVEDYKRLGNLITVTHGDDTFVDLNNYYYYASSGGWYGENGEAAQRYISYLYADRPIYRTTDTIRTWGVARSRDEALSAPAKTVTLALTDYFLGTLAEAEAQVKADGTFTGELPLEGLASGWFNLELRIGGKAAYSQYLTVEDYVKPVYTAETFTNKPVYMPGAGDEEATLTARVSLFDGTPANRFGLDLTTDLEILQPVSQTDEAGAATATLALQNDKSSWYPDSSWYSFSSAEPQNENFYLSGSVYTIHRDVMLRGAAVPGTQGQSMTVETNRIDVSGITDTDQLWDPANFTGAALDLDVEAEIHKEYYTKTVIGHYYDFINRETVETYRYERQDEVVDTRAFRTSGGQYRLDGLPPSGEDAAYYVVLRCQDTRDRAVSQTVYLGALFENRNYGTSTTRYELRKDTGEEDRQTWEHEGIVQYYWDGNRFGDGEDVNFTLYRNGDPVTDMPGRLLYSLVQADFENTAVSESSRVAVPFAESLLPNYVLTGAYFDGKHVFELANTNMAFNPEDRELEIALSPEKDSYAPGDSVAVTAAVTDKATGQPASGVSLVLGAVDEAIFAIRDQYINFLPDLYRSVYFPNIQKYTSDVPMADAAAGEMGGGGGDSGIRKDFADTAAFDTATTGGDGRAKFSFKLPDNITEWRLTSLGLSTEGDAGQTAGGVVATKPFFVTPVVNATLLDGDEMAVGLYGAGSAVASGDITSYTVTVKGGDVNEQRSIASPLRQYATLAFGKLPAGDYTVTVEGSCGGYTDGVELPFTVKASGVEVSIVKSFELSAGLQVEPLRWPVSVALYGDGAKTWNMALRALQCGSGGQRADMRLARTYAARLLEGMGKSWYDEEALTQDLSDVDGRHMMRLFPHTDADLELTVKARLAAPELVGDGFLKSLSSGGILNYMETSPGAVYLARALAGEHLDDKLQTLANNPAATYVDKVYAAMAMAQSGNEAGAKAVYDSLVLPSLVQSTGVSGLTMLAVEAGDAQYTNEQCTGAASMLATMLQTKEAAGLITQLTEKGSKYEPFLLEQMYYLTATSPGGGNAAFSYSLDGKTETVKLDSGIEVLTLTKAQFEAANFKTTSGTVYADVYYVGGAQQLSASDEGNRLGLTKTVRAVDGDFGMGSLVEITLTPDFSGLDTSAGNLLLYVDEYVPSGMRFVRYMPEEGYPYSGDMTGWYLNSRQEQRLQFTVYGLRGELKLRPIVYYARVTTPGEYVVESAYLSSASADSWGLSARDTVQLG